MKRSSSSNPLILILVMSALMAVCGGPSGQVKAHADSSAATKSTLLEILSDRSLWGPDGLSALLSLQAWHSVGENHVSILGSTILSETPLNTVREAERPAAQLRSALKARQSRIDPKLAAAWQVQGSMPPQAVSILPKFYEDRSVRITARDDGARYIPVKLLISEVQTR